MISPRDDSEFATKKTRSAVASLVSHRIDLLTAVMHELGHVLGHNDLAPSSHHDDLMSATLAPGVRHTSYTSAVDAIFGPHGLMK